MEILSEYTIPTLHPLMVHFPLVLLLLAAGAATIWWARPVRVWWTASMVLLGLAVAAVAAALRTGVLLREEVGSAGLVGRLLESHETAAWTTLWVSLAALIVSGIVRALDRLDVHRAYPAWWHRAAVALAMLAAAAAVAWTAHLGGLMVWGVAR